MRKFWSKDRVREYLSKLDIHKSMGSDGMCPQALRELSLQGYS